ncbi:DsbA family protein [Mumia sp. DW29H23]|uniref:DsbA family protein n=1 Tax=Mumia sp. DW29H23 TaxID=3421241 RepID=UPI003D69E6F0
MTRSRIAGGLLACLASLVLVACVSAADVATGGPGGGSGLALTADGGVVVTANDLDPSGSFPDDPVAVAVYVEPLCPHCKAFAADQGRLLEERLAAGAITLEYRMVSFLDNGTTGHASARSVNAALCVAETGGPAAYDAFVTGLLDGQTPSGLSDEDLVALADDAGAAGAEACIEAQEHADLVAELTNEAMETIEGTPTVVVDGKTLQGTPTTTELAAMLGTTTV